MENNITRTIIYAGQQPTEEQIHEIEQAALMPIITDEDAPELTKEQYAEMTAIAKQRRKKQIQPTISLRISLDTLERAKATGTNYTDFLSRLLENAMNDPQMVSKSL
ncbi:MAG: BrnA antitoxin family protein [Lachnospiraceae bacterium]|nr:BrnA antitoxin family protein [Lachnospiraceae bacterium]